MEHRYQNRIELPRGALALLFMQTLHAVGRAARLRHKKQLAVRRPSRGRFPEAMAAVLNTAGGEDEA